jgi:peptidoglycan hydrolase FlgJ
VNFAIAGVGAGAAAAGPVVTAGAAEIRHKKLVEAAQQFEGMLLQEMLKPMKERGFCEGDEDSGADKDEGGGFGDTLKSFGAESVATAIAKGGGLGIAKTVVKEVEREKR